MDVLDLPKGCGGIDIALRKKIPPSMSMHSHSFYELVFVYAGKGVHITDQGEYEIGAGDLFVVPPGAAHGYCDRHDVSLMNIMFDVKVMAMAEELADNESGFRAFFQTAPALRDDFRFRNKLTLADEDRENCEKITYRLHYESTKKLPGWRLGLFAALAQLFVLIARASTATSRGKRRELMLLDKTIQTMRLEMRKRVSIPLLAKRAGVSGKSLERLFLSATQRAPVAYLNDLRLNEAARLLRETDKKISALSAESGFSDGNYFSKLFRAKFAMSPREYRSKSLFDS